MILKLVTMSNQDTVRTLRAMLTLAEAGELRDFAAYYRCGDGGEDAVFTGLFRRDPAHGLRAAMQMSMAVNRAQGILQGR